MRTPKTKLSGPVDNQEVATAVPEITEKEGTFKITIKADETDAEGNVTGEKTVYENKKEPFKFFQVPSLVSALRFLAREDGFTGELFTDDQITFLNDALRVKIEGEPTETDKVLGKAVKELVTLFNEYLEASAQKRQYAKVLADKTPYTEENLTNAAASQVRNYIKQQIGRGKEITDEVAVATLIQFDIIPSTFTVKMFRENKGKR